MKSRRNLRVLWAVSGLALGATLALGEARADMPTAVATFHSISLYWNPEGGGADHKVRVQYREADTDVRFDGLDMRYNPIAGTDLDLADYRGSLVHLRSGATYEIELSLDDGSETETLEASTWSEALSVAKSIQVPSGGDRLEITESGTEAGYVLYDGTGSTLDVGGQDDYDITVDASYVILRGFTLGGAGRDAIRILGGHDIIIEGCDMAGWGRVDFDGDYGQNMDAAVFCSDGEVTRVVVQRCRMHDPRHDANSWAEYNCHAEGSCSNHPAEPQAIVFYNSAGNHVFRYNKVWSDADHYYNDILGGGSNGSFEGFPGPDSDIYGNDLANCWDDGIEAEGGGRNVRLWANHDTDTYLAYANAAVSIGPLYMWRNVSGRCYSPDESQYGTYGPFLKMGYASSEDWMTGHMYIFHNTVWNEDDQGCSGIGGSGRYIKHCVTRNNVLHVRSDAPRSIAVRSENIDNDYDYDLYSAEVPDGSEAHGIQGTPTYVSGAGYDADQFTGEYQLQEGTPGHDGAEPLPNFDDYYLGDGPDMGVQETGSEPMVFGVEAGHGPTIETTELETTAVGDVVEQTLEAGGGRRPVLWTLIAGSLPDGLTLHRDGSISGVAQATGVYSLSVYARDADSLLDRADLTLTVLEAGTCAEPRVRCGDACVDLTQDAQNCGACGHACPDGEICEESICVAGPDGGAGTSDAGGRDGAAPEAGSPDAGAPDAATGGHGATDAGSGCGCMAAGRMGGPWEMFWLQAALLGLIAAKRRASSSQIRQGLRPQLGRAERLGRG